MKKIRIMLAMSCLLSVGAFTAIHADMRNVPENNTVYLTYGKASANDSKTDHSYNYQTKGTCTGGTYSMVAIYVKDSNGSTKSSNSCGNGRSCEATWFASGRVSHTHSAASAITQ